MDSEMYGIPICNSCKSGLRLFSEETINRQSKEYKSSKKYADYKSEISDRLVILEKDYTKKKIKLLYILEQLNNL